MKIIAEVGSNFSSEADLINSITIAKQCGADIVKFQFFSQNDLYGIGSEQYNFSPNLLPYLNSKCLEQEIELMCSAFSPGGYDIVNDFVKTHKIASSELSAKDILKTVNSYGKPVIFSNGGSTLSETIAAGEQLSKCEVTAMWCVGNYPAKLIDFDQFEKFIERMPPKYQIGFSDHSIDALNIPLSAKQLGAKVLEKHVNFFDVKGPDSGHSLNKFEFEIMCSNLKYKTCLSILPPLNLPLCEVRKHKRIYSEKLKRWVRPIV